jgi:uncharacterized protein (DUF58 family)
LAPFGARTGLLVVPRTFQTQQSIGLIGLTLGLWFAGQWLSYCFRTAGLRRHLLVHLEVFDERGLVDTLWAGRTFTVRLEITLDQRLSLPHAAIEKRVPFGAELRHGRVRYDGPLLAGESLVLEYSMRCATIGDVRFEGFQIEVTDLQGFFYERSFVRTPVVYRVLPPLVDARGQVSTSKRQNLLPPPGQHHHRRPGSGSELLDLRDYLPGDPPKTIAWKVSARRDRLITKEFESEVPVRCTLFVDTSDSVRLGPPGQNALAGLIQIATAVAQAATGSRDLVGVCLFNEADAEYIRPARGPRHLVQVLNRLADAAVLSPSAGSAPPDAMIPIAYTFASEVYPELMNREVNRVPLFMDWLAPQPAYTRRRPGWLDRLYGLLPLWLPLYLVLGFAAVVVCWLWVNELINWFLTEHFETMPPMPLVLVVIVGTGAVLGLSFLRLPRYLFFPERRRLARQRKPLAALLSVRYGLGPGGLELLLANDELFSRHVQRFLAEHHVPYPVPLYDRQGQYRFASVAKIQVLARMLTRAVGKGHDNELYVLLVDLLELSDSLGVLLRAVKVALARHHRVMVICPWPPGMALPGKDGPAEDDIVVDVQKSAEEDLLSVLTQTTTRRYQQAFQQLRWTFGRLKVPVICAQPTESPRLVLERLDLLRMLGKSR